MNIIVVYKELTISQLFFLDKYLYLWYNKIGDSMKIDKFKFRDEEVNLAIFDDDEIETNEVLEEELDKTINISELIEGEKHE